MFPVFGSDYLRASIRSVRFAGDLSVKPDDAWNASESGHDSAWAWASPSDEVDVNGKPLYDLTIAGDGGIKLNVDCGYLFYRYINLKSIDFGDCVDTSNVTNIQYMFWACKSLSDVIISDHFVIDNTDKNIFYACSLTSISDFTLVL